MNSTVKNMLKVVSLVFGVGVLGAVGIQEYTNTRPVIVQYYGEIQGDVQYFKLLNTLRTANYGQRIDIYMISPGGSVLHGFEIAQAMKESHGTVVYHVGSLAASMAAVLACQADKLDMAPQATLMYHTVQSASGPLLDPAKDTYDYTALAGAKELTKNCKFLTKEELAKIWSGGEVWLTGTDVNKRLGHENN
jgi:ATP-dependent protease ClpP protease subunit